MLIGNLNYSVINLLLNIHQLVDKMDDITKLSILRFVVIIIVTVLKTCIFNWLDVSKIVTDSSKNIPNLLLIFILCGDNHLLIKVIDSNDITNHVLQGSLKPIYPVSKSLNL